MRPTHPPPLPLVWPASIKHRNTPFTNSSSQHRGSRNSSSPTALQVPVSGPMHFLHHFPNHFHYPSLGGSSHGQRQGQDHGVRVEIGQKGLSRNGSGASSGTVTSKRGSLFRSRRNKEKEISNEGGVWMGDGSREWEKERGKLESRVSPSQSQTQMQGPKIRGANGSICGVVAQRSTEETLRFMSGNLLARRPLPRTLIFGIEGLRSNQRLKIATELVPPSYFY